MTNKPKDKEFVELVNDFGTPIGQALKSEVHTSNTALHRAFSVYVFNSKGQLLIQQRSSFKKTWPLFWTNTCCGHPNPGESTFHAVQRRLKQELGLSIKQLWNVLPNFRYRVSFHGIFENELCPVFLTFSDQPPEINTNEVAAIRWINWPVFQKEALAPKSTYSPWCVTQVKQLRESAKFERLMQENTSP